MRIRILLTHSQKNFAISVSLCTPRQTFGNRAEDIGPIAVLGTVAKRRRRSDETLLGAFLAAYIRDQVEPTTHASGCAYEERDGETMTQSARRTPHATPKSCCARGMRNHALAGALALAGATPFAAEPQCRSSDAHLQPHRGHTADRRAAGAYEGDGPGQRGARRDQRSGVLQQHHPQLGGALDQSQSVGVRAAQRLHGHRRRHGARQRPVQHPAERRSVYIGDGKSGEPAYSASNNAMYDALDANNVDLSVHLVAEHPVGADRHPRDRHRRRA